MEAEFATLSEKEIQIISTLELQASDWNKYMKIVHVTKDPKLIADLKVYEKRMGISGWKFHVCDTLEEARKWVEA